MDVVFIDVVSIYVLKGSLHIFDTLLAKLLRRPAIILKVRSR